MAEATATVTVTVDRPVSEVFAFLADYANCHRWQTGLVEARTEGAMGVGAHITTTRKVLGRDGTSRVRVTEFDVDRRIRTRSVSGPVDYEGGYDFEDVGGRTRLTYRGKITTGMLLGPVGKLMAKGFQSRMEEDLATLKRVLEG